MGEWRGSKGVHIGGGVGGSKGVHIGGGVEGK